MSVERPAYSIPCGGEQAGGVAGREEREEGAREEEKEGRGYGRAREEEEEGRG